MMQPKIRDRVVVQELGNRITGFVTGRGTKDGSPTVEYFPGTTPPEPGALGSKWCRLSDVLEVTPVETYPGLRVQTLGGEMDTDSDGQERRTPPGSWGEITSHNHADHWDLVFPNGTWVVVTEAELRDVTQYHLESPQSQEQQASSPEDSPNNKKTVQFRNIVWDTDGIETTLPNETVLEVNAGAVVSLEGADALSDKFGFSVISFDFMESTVHNFIGESPGDVYDRTQTDDSIKDGDILNLGNGNIAILVQAWPTVVCGEIEHFHKIEDGYEFEKIDNGKYALSVTKARAVASDISAEAENRYYVWCDDDCQNVTASLIEAKKWRDEFTTEGRASWIIDANNNYITDGEVENPVQPQG